MVDRNIKYKNLMCPLHDIFVDLFNNKEYIINIVVFNTSIPFYIDMETNKLCKDCINNMLCHLCIPIKAD